MIALYARVSTDAQVEAGLASQLAELRRYLKDKYPGESVLEFIDDGYSGADLERPKFDELRTQVRCRRIRVVLAYDPDRLSRDAAHLLLLMKEFEQNGATLDLSAGDSSSRTVDACSCR
jgi:site-specific DNA recombinase